MMSEGGETAADTNINFLLEEFGIVCNSGNIYLTIFKLFWQYLNLFIKKRQ